MMEPVALGVVGCGVIGRSHIRAAVQSPLVKVVAVADILEARTRELAEQYGIPRQYVQGTDLLDDPVVEAVILALPTCGRLALAMKAFSRGIHLLTEKPVAMNAGEVHRMIAARGKLVALCGQSRVRYSQTAQRVSEFIATGALGELRVLNCRAITAPSGPPKTPPPTWRLSRAQNGGGILMNWGCYDLDYLLGLTGWRLKPRVVLARAWTVPPIYQSFIAPGSDAETHVTALILCEGGTAVNYERSEYTAGRPEAMWQVTGSQGTLHLQMAGGKESAVTLDRATRDHGTVSQELFPPIDEPKDQMLGQLEDFALAIREGRRPHTGLEEALVVQEIIDAIYASAQRGTLVDIH